MVPGFSNPIFTQANAVKFINGAGLVMGGIAGAAVTGGYLISDRFTEICSASLYCLKNESSIYDPGYCIGAQLLTGTAVGAATGYKITAVVTEKIFGGPSKEKTE